MNQQDMFTILSDSDRQHVIRTLIDNGGQSTVEDLAKRTVSRRREPSPEGTRSADFERAKIGLLHNHLPRLADYGVIEHDEQRGDVALVDAEELEPYIAVATRGKSISPEH